MCPQGWGETVAEVIKDKHWERQALPHHTPTRPLGLRQESILVCAPGREGNLPPGNFYQISVVSLVEGQFFLILYCHGGNQHQADREVQQVVQGHVRDALCRKIQISPGNQQLRKTQVGVGEWGGVWVSAPSGSFSELQPSELAITGAVREWPDNCLWLSPLVDGRRISIAQALLYC